MRYLSKEEEKGCIAYIAMAGRYANESTCLRDKCGSVIVNNIRVIGAGFNSPPGNIESQRRCQKSKGFYHKKVSDRTCCVHAEQRAIMDALRRNPEKLEGSRLYFTRVSDTGEIQRSGKPYCTICSKMALDVGIGEFVLWDSKGIVIYDTEEYNNLSFEYKG